MDEKPEAEKPKMNTDMYAVYAGRFARETLIECAGGKALLKRGFPTLVPEGLKEQLIKNPNFVFVSEATATPILKKLRDAEDRPAQFELAEKYVETLIGAIEKRKDEHTTARKKLRKDRVDATKAAQKKAMMEKYTIVVPGEEELPEDAEDLGPTPAPAEEKTPMSAKPGKKDPGKIPGKEGPPKGGDGK